MCFHFENLQYALYKSKRNACAAIIVLFLVTLNTILTVGAEDLNMKRSSQQVKCTLVDMTSQSPLGILIRQVQQS